MAREIIWSPAALAEVEEIVTYVRARSEERARRIGESFFDNVEVLRSFPGIGPIYFHDPTGSVREIMCGSFRIFYAVDQRRDRIEILAVRHGARRDPDPKQLLDRVD